MVEGEDEGEAAAYAARLARVVMTASAAIDRGDVAFAARLLRLFAEKIRAGVSKEQARQDAGATRH